MEVYFVIKKIETCIEFSFFTDGWWIAGKRKIENDLYLKIYCNFFLLHDISFLKYTHITSWKHVKF